MRRILTLTLALSVFTPTVVHAQSKEDIRAAKSLVSDGKDLYKAGKYEEAAAAFKQAYDLSRRSELLFNVGESYRLAGKLREAESHFQQHLAEAPQAPNADDVVAAIVEIQQQLAAELATVQVDTAVPGRGVFIDDEGEPRCITPCSVTVAPGSRRVTVRGEGVSDHVDQLQLEPGTLTQLTAKLTSGGPHGLLMISIDRPAGTLRVGELTERLPLEQPLDLEAGEYDVSVESARNARWSGVVTIEANETTEMFLPMQSLVDARKRGSVRKSIAYGLGGVSVAAGVGGILLGMQARDTFARLEASNPPLDAELVQQGRNQQVAANVMFATASTALLTGVVLFVWDAVSSDKDPTPK